MSQYLPIDETDGPEITPEYVNRRVDDWLQRLTNLFNEIKAWAKANRWSAEDGAPIPMHEELMEQCGVPKRQQPTLSVRSPNGVQIWIKPKGLWVIGANGRVDVFSHKGAFTLVDIADPFQAPRWVLHRIGVSDGRPFDPKQLTDMI